MNPASPATDPVAALRERLSSVPWRLLQTGPAAGARNMALDVALLEEAAAGRIAPTLRFYTWSPAAVSLGHFQPEAEIDRDAAVRRGWSVVRRPTGGRAVLHDRELTYSVVLPPAILREAGVRTSYAALIALLHGGLSRLLPSLDLPPRAEGPACHARQERSPNCFALASECDTLLPEGKLVGSAQVRRGGALLQHGSILLDADRQAWTELFGTAGRLVTLREVRGALPSLEEVTSAVVAGFQESGIALHPGELTPQERDALAGKGRTA